MTPHTIESRSPLFRRPVQLAFGLLVLVGAVALLVWTEKRALEKRAAPAASHSEPGAEAGRLAFDPPMPETGTERPRAFGAVDGNPRPGPPPDELRSPLADSLHHPDRHARDDLAILAEILANHLGAFRELPVGSNAEITAALSGDNARSHAPLPRDHPAINAAGELTDRWGTPYFFHQLAADMMEIRTAGPDRHPFTVDDVVWPAAPTEPQPESL